MWKKLRSVGLALVVICVFGATSAIAQAAVHWTVGGKTITEPKELAENATLEKVEESESSPSLTITVFRSHRITCSGSKILNGKILVSSKDEASSLTFSGCSVKTAAGASTTCTVKSVGEAIGTIDTNATTTALKEVAGKAYDVFTPVGSAEGVFATIEIAAESGKTCALSGKNALHGTFALEVAVGTNETTLKGFASEATATAAGTKLEYGAREALLHIRLRLALKLGFSWGVSL